MATLWTILIAFSVGVVATWIFLRKNPLWLSPFLYIRSKKGDAKDYLRRRLDRL